MKQISLIVLVVVFFCSCSKNPEDIMRVNLDKFMREKYLIIPKSYNPAKFQIQDTVRVEDLLKEYDSLLQMETKIKSRHESYCEKLDVLTTAYQNNQYFNLPKLRELTKIRDDTEKWIKDTDKRTDSLYNLFMKRTGNIWKCRDPKSIMFYKALHTYEAKNTGGNIGVYVVQVYFDTTYQIHKIYRMNY